MNATESDIETLRIHTEASSSECKIAVPRKQASAAASDVLGPLEYTRSDIRLLIRQCRHDKDLINAAVASIMEDSSRGVTDRTHGVLCEKKARANENARRTEKKKKTVATLAQTGQFSDPPPACYEPGYTCHLSKKSPIPEKRRMTNFKEMRGGEDRELSGRSNFLIDSAREKGGGGNFLMNFCGIGVLSRVAPLPSTLPAPRLPR